MALASLILACQFQAPDPDPAAALLAMVNHRSQALKSQALSSQALSSQELKSQTLSSQVLKNRELGSQALKSQALSSRELKSQVRGLTVENVQNVRPRTSAAHVVKNVENVGNV